MKTARRKKREKKALAKEAKAWGKVFGAAREFAEILSKARR